MSTVLKSGGLSAPIPNCDEAAVTLYRVHNGLSLAEQSTTCGQGVIPHKYCGITETGLERLKRSSEQGPLPGDVLDGPPLASIGSLEQGTGRVFSKKSGGQSPDGDPFVGQFKVVSPLP
jgi:hypothetical protein